MPAQTFGPTSCKPFIPDPSTTYRAEIPEDDGKPNTFDVHFKRGTLRPRMSALELAEFMLPHMPAILPFLRGERVRQDWLTLLTMLANLTTRGWQAKSKEAIDHLVPWIRSMTRTQEADIIHLELGAQFEQRSPSWFVLGGASA